MQCVLGPLSGFWWVDRADSPESVPKGSPLKETVWGLWPPNHGFVEGDSMLGGGEKS